MENVKKVSPVKTVPTAPARQDVLTPKMEVLKKLPFDEKMRMPLLVLGIVIALLGVGSGWVLAGNSPKGSVKKASTEAKVADVKEAGSGDEDLFPDSAEGTLVEGGINGEGTHKLERGMGPEKDVYLLSTVLDLDSFIGKKVQIWGKTVSSQEAGWLMDVGKVKVLE